VNSLLLDPRFELFEILDEEADDPGIELTPGHPADELDGLLAGESLAILAILMQRIEAIHHGEYARGDWNVVTFERIGVALPVPSLVMVAHNRNNRIRKSYTLHYLRADDCVNLHLLELGSSKLARFVQYVIRHGQLTNVVKKRSYPQSLDLRLG
jgi:hypothetical protein